MARSWYVMVAALCAALLALGCRSVDNRAVSETAAAAGPEGGGDSGYRYAGVSTVTVKPGRARVLAVSYNSGEKVDEGGYTWAVTDPEVVSARGSGNKCVIVGKREGSTLVVVTSPDILLPYAFRVICTADEAAGRSFRRTRDERTEGRLVGGWSGIEMVEKAGE